MANTDAYALQRSDLNGFLFADVGVEASGMPLSVLSTLARLGMDPWQEAGRLAKLPRAAAIDGLARIIAAMPASLWSLPDATAIAVRLVGLLPARGNTPSPAPPGPPGNAATLAERLAGLLPGLGDGRPSGRSTPLAPGSFRANRHWAVVVALLAAMFVGLALNLFGPRAVSDSDVAARWPASQSSAPATPPVSHAPTSE